MYTPLIVDRNSYGILCLLMLLNVVTQMTSADQVFVLSDEFDICSLFADGVQMRKPGYCTKTIQCVNHQSVDLEDCVGSKSFATTKGKCANRGSDSYCQAPCTAKSPFYVADKRNCEGWYECNKATAKKNGYCPDHLHFDQSLQACVESSATNCSVTYKVCDVAPTDTMFKVLDNCGKYAQCVSTGKGVIEKSVDCNSNMYYDVDLSKCKPKSEVKCDKYPYPKNVCGTTKLAKRGQFVSDGATCSGYFYCHDLGSGKPDPEPKWRQCPNGTFFREDMQICMDRNHVSCVEDRCDGIEDGKVLSEKYGCQYYLQCKNNATQGTDQYCGTNLYFDPITEKCNSNRELFPICQ